MAGFEERDNAVAQDEVDEEELIEHYALESIQDRFFEPWDDSDLILVVEQRKIHVHRLILTLASPVFKQMLNGTFAERNMQEIPLPGKDAFQFISFLRQIYPQYKDTLHEFNCDFLYKLADEYQVENLKESCLDVIGEAKLEQNNIFQVIKASKLVNNEEMHEKSLKAAQELTMKDILYLHECRPLYLEDLYSLVKAKAMKLENCLEKVLPEFVGLLDLALYFWFQQTEDSLPPTPCPAHYMNGKACKGATVEERLQCKACLMMYKTMQLKLLIGQEDGEFVYSYSDSGFYYRDIVSSLKEMSNLLNSDVTRSVQ